MRLFGWEWKRFLCGVRHYAAGFVCEESFSYELKDSEDKFKFFIAINTGAGDDDHAGAFYREFQRK